MSNQTLFDIQEFCYKACSPKNYEKLVELTKLDSKEDKQLLLQSVIQLAIESQEFRSTFFQLPFPFDSNIEGIGYVSDYNDLSYTLKAGIANIRTLDKYWCMYRKTDQKTLNVLDFGCGTGRLLRFASEFGSGVKLFGCDVNPVPVQWLSSHFNNCQVGLINKKYDLSFLPEKMDLIYAWSIFTHYDENEHINWLNTLANQLKKDGILIATFKGRDSITRLLNDDDFRKKSRADNVDIRKLLKDFDTQGFTFFPIYDVQLSNKYNIDANTFGQAYIAPNYIEKQWSQFFNVLRITEAVKGWQDLVVLQRR